MKLIMDDCLNAMAGIEGNSVDALVTDPPAGISFMGKDWDHHKGGRDQWIAWMTEVMKECLRVMKPGAHGLVWAIPRTSHWTATALENAGFEVRDVVTHLFGSGFPKSLDISKAIDKAAGAKRDVIGKKTFADGTQTRSNAGKGEKFVVTGNSGLETAPATDSAKQWSGWGTALKPASEHWILIRKPCSEKTVAANVLKWGTGGINIDGTRVNSGPSSSVERRKSAAPKESVGATGWLTPARPDSYNEQRPGEQLGRFPANLILDEVAAEMLDDQSGTRNSGGAIKAPTTSKSMFKNADQINWDGYKDSGGASRFFYVAKSSRRERNQGVQDLLTWENADQNLAGKMVELSQLARDISEDTMRMLGGIEWSTLLSGNSITDQSPADIKYTTETILNLITELRTSNASPPSIIKGNILDAIRMIEANGLSLAESVALFKKLTLTITNVNLALALGASLVASAMLLRIRESAKTGNIHSTVKPQKLMQYLITLITPPNGVVLDPFMGSGSTGVAAKALGFQFTGIEREAEYFEIASKRIGAF